ncbi:hypothetical protein PybrP1_001155 [[Pythium] brassicae (nom. inval.)]|nr:hypothetical protein PybrP1_001155 [[Pythium] brassicae (nom. inval.)]
MLAAVGSRQGLRARRNAIRGRRRVAVLGSDQVPAAHRCRSGGASVRLVRAGRGAFVPPKSWTLIRTPVDAQDGGLSMFLPRAKWTREVPLPQTVAAVRDSAIMLMGMNTSKKRVRAPSRRALGTWHPLEQGTDIVPFTGALSRERVTVWLSRCRGRQAGPITDEEQIDIGALLVEDRALVLKCCGTSEPTEAAQGVPAGERDRRAPFHSDWRHAPIYWRQWGHQWQNRRADGQDVQVSVRGTRVNYLGHRLTAAGIRPLDRLVTAVTNFPQPHDEHGVERFVHLVGYCRRLIPRFAVRASALKRLFRKDVPFEWKDEQQAAFEDLRTVLAEKPVLLYPDLPRLCAGDGCVQGRVWGSAHAGSRARQVASASQAGAERRAPSACGRRLGGGAASDSVGKSLLGMSRLHLVWAPTDVADARARPVTQPVATHEDYGARVGEIVMRLRFAQGPSTTGRTSPPQFGNGRGRRLDVARRGRTVACHV